jgi:glycine/D-amino acid oxidase-like deaminating enzyme
MPAADTLTRRLSLWDETAPRPPETAPLRGERRADAVIVGGGFTGCAAALRLAEAGKDVVLLEAAGFGEGGSGRNVGLVNAGLWMPPGDIEAAMGEAAARRLSEPLAQGPARVFALIERHQMQCEAVREGTIHAAHNEAGLTDLKRRHAQWQKLGAPVTLLDEAETARRTGTKVFKGGLFDARAGTINPMGYVRGLARAAINAGADLHGASAVIKLERRDGLWRVETAEGAVTAPHVVLTTNAYSGDLLPGLERAFTPIDFYQLASAPLGGRESGILPGREGLWDTGKIMTAIRVDAAGRLLLGSMGALYGQDAALTKRWAEKTLRRLFPELGPVSWEAAWSGRIAMTRDHLPRLLSPEPGLYVPIGYNGRGISPGTVFGEALADLIAGRIGEDELPLALTKRWEEPLREPRRLFYAGAFRAFRLWKSL